MRFVRIGLLVAVAFALSGCGAKNESASVPAGAELAPASVPVFVSIATDPEGDQWQAADRLLTRFPGREKLLASFRSDLEGLDWERDVKPALPDEVHIVWVDFANDGNDVVGYAKPADESKFDKLLESGNNPLVHRKIDGWTVFADTRAKLDRFESARSSGDPLADNKAFRDAMKKLPADAAARGWVSGPAIQAEIERAAATSPDAQQFKSFTTAFGTIESISFSAKAEDQGVKFDAAYKAKDQPKAPTFSDDLDSSLPTGALAYASFGNLDDSLNDALKALDKSSPEFRAQRSQIEQALGFSLKNDLFPLFSKEGALAVYRAGGAAPSILLALRVPDEAQARRVVDRLAAFASLAGRESGVTVRDATVSGAKGKEFVIASGGSPISVFALVSDGKAFVTNSRAALEQALGDAAKLSDDGVYRSARDSAGVPDETAGFVYLNLRAGLPYVFGFAEKEQRGAIPPDVRANTKPLESAFLYTKQDGDRLSVSGFLAIQ